jgi:hypothetical protein
MKPRHAAALAVICLASCATTKEFAATGGSRADGVVVLSYEYGPLRVSRGNDEQGDALATSSCVGWGYSGAVRYGESQQCITHDWGIPDLFVACKTLVKRSYHCLGAAALPEP